MIEERISGIFPIVSNILAMVVVIQATLSEIMLAIIAEEGLKLEDSSFLNSPGSHGFGAR